jgi:hypothetical protein
MARNLTADKIYQGGNATSGSGKADQTIGTKPIRSISGPSLKPSNVGPTKAPYYDNNTQK